MRGLGFVPIWICHHRVSHRRICSCGLAFLYAVGYLRRIRWLSGIRRSGYTAEVCCFVRSANGWDATRECVMRRDNMVNAMNMLMEVALLVGSIFAANQVAGYTGVLSRVHLLPRRIPRPCQVQRMAAPVVAVMITGTC
ncbi:YhfT family protein [Shigella boydii]